ncbi:MAG: hypothetical protein Q8O91_03540, partial [Candidatus Aminicenantes bacterium]|nr:hypothetical protein [Candidatus Aminicenantes bacterium]
MGCLSPKLKDLFFEIPLCLNGLLQVKGRAFAAEVKGRAFGSPLTRVLYQRASTAEVDPRAKPRAPAAVDP